MLSLLSHKLSLVQVMLRCAAGVVIVVVFYSCATQRPPSGGPVDTISPEIIGTEPPNRTTHFTGHSFRFTFSEYVDRQSFENNLHISPLLSEPPEFDWSGKSVEVIIPDQRRANTTYVLSVGTDVADIRNRNKMARNFFLAVSTGDSIDQGFIRGEINGQNPTGISLFAYRLSGRNPDTLNPSTLLPDYIVQTGSDGTFTLSNIAVDRYRFFVVRDKIKNNVYDVQSDEFGVLPNDIDVQPNDTLRSPIHFRFTSEDTTRPMIQSVEAVDQRHVLLKLSEAPNIDTLALSWFHMIDSVEQKSIPFLCFTPVAKKPTQLVLTTASEMTPTKYFVSIDSLSDAAGNIISKESNPFVFFGIAEPDTTQPVLITADPANTETGVAIDAPVILFFSDAIDPVQVSIVMSDSSKHPVQIQHVFLTRSVLRIDHPILASGQLYTLCINLSSIIKITNGKRAGDSSYCITFTTTSESEVGTLEGRVDDQQNLSQKIVIETIGVNAVGRAKKYSSAAARDGSFVFQNIPAGKYIVSAYVDENQNLRYDFGKPFPFQASERFGVLRDTVRVRAQWNTRDIRITIP